MKKLLLVFALCLLCIFSLTACNKDEPEVEGNPIVDNQNQGDNSQNNGNKDDNQNVGSKGEVVYSEGLEFTSNGDGSCNVGIGTCVDTNIVIPPTSPDGDRVTGIVNFAFSYYFDLISIVIPESVTSIGGQAFKGCKSLTSITVDDNNQNYKSVDGNLYTKDGKTLVLYAAAKTDDIFTVPDGVTSIGEYAFEYCTALRNIVIPDSVTSIEDGAFADCSSLTSIVIPDGVTSIGYNMFWGCRSLTSIVLPDSVTSIGIQAFAGCTSLTSIVIPKGVTSIGMLMFTGCISLTSIVLPDSVSYINGEAFSGCGNLIDITIDENNPDFTSVDGVVYTKDGKTLVVYAPGKTEPRFAIPDGVTNISSRAFVDCKHLVSVTIPGSVTNIAGEEGGLPYVFNSSFYGCSNLVEVYNLSALNIEKGSTQNGCAGYYAFDVYTSLSEESKIFENSDGFVFYENGYVCYLLSYVGDDTAIILPDSCNGKNYEIYQYAFYCRENLTSVTISNGVTSIGDYAFRDCDSLTGVTIGNSVTSIGVYAFFDCTSLTSVSIGDSVTSIGDFAFYYCYSLTSVTIGNSVTSIGDWALYGCTSLTSIVIPNSVTTIGEETFGNCGSLMSITIGNGLIIPEGAFYGCTSLMNIIVDENNPNYKSIDGNLYTKDGRTLVVYALGKTESSFAIPNGVTCIGEYVFSNCSSLTSIVIPDSVTEISSDAFYDCESLTDVYYKGSVSEWHQIIIGSNNEHLTSANITYNYTE